MKRTFIAIKTAISEESEALLNHLKRELKDEKIRWVDTNNLHLTLFFIGDTSEELINEIKKKLMTELNNVKSFKLSCKGLGVFRNVYNPKAIWFGFEDSMSLDRLKNNLNQALKDLGFEIEEKIFKPHLTIGRTKHIKNKNKLKELMSSNENVKIQDFYIKEVSFYESILTSKGATYKVIDTFLLT